MPEQITRALEVLAAVMIYATAWFIGFTSIMGVPAVWRKFKKMSDKEKKEHEEIIVKRAESIVELDKERTAVADEIIKAKDEILRLKEEKALLRKEIKAEKKEKSEEVQEPSGQEKTAQSGTQAPTRGRKGDSKPKKEVSNQAPA